MLWRVLYAPFYYLCCPTWLKVSLTRKLASARSPCCIIQVWAPKSLRSRYVSLPPSESLVCIPLHAERIPAEQVMAHTPGGQVLASLSPVVAEPVLRAVETPDPVGSNVFLFLLIIITLLQS